MLSLADIAISGSKNFTVNIKLFFKFQEILENKGILLNYYSNRIFYLIESNR